MSENKLKVSSSPHIRDKVTSGNIMLMVVIALLPASAFGVYNFGLSALIMLISTTVSSVLTEYVYEKLMHKKITINDFSAVVTGLLLGLNMPPTAPWWMGVLGGIFAILVVKQLFGGLGQNFMNPALGARCFLMISFAGQMTTFVYDGVTGATPLSYVKEGALDQVNTMNMLIGTIPGTIGETSVIAIIIGAIFLILMGVIDLRIPGTYIVTFAIFVGIFRPCGSSGDRIFRSSVHHRPPVRRRPYAGSLVYGHRLCNVPHHQEGPDRIWYRPGSSDRSVPDLRRQRGGRFLRDHYQ